MKKILVTGAGGYIGRHVVDALLKYDNIQIIACDLRIDQINPRVEAIEYDIFSNSENIYHELGSPDICIHLAWRDGFIHQSNAHMEDLSKQYIFLNNLISNGLDQVAVMGTMHEVGYHVGAITDETYCNPVSMYGIAKDALRRSMFTLTKGTSVILQWLRAFYIYGDDQNNHSIFTKIIEAERSGQKTFPFNTGQNKYDFIKISDLAKQIVASVMQHQITGIINCCTGSPISLKDKVEEFILENGFKIKLDYGVFPDRDYDSPEIWGNSDKIMQIMKTDVLLRRER